jgi:hypothetical protein
MFTLRLTQATPTAARPRNWAGDRSRVHVIAASHQGQPNCEAASRQPE